MPLPDQTQCNRSMYRQVPGLAPRTFQGPILGLGCQLGRRRVLLAQGTVLQRGTAQALRDWTEGGLGRVPDPIPWVLLTKPTPNPTNGSTVGWALPGRGCPGLRGTDLLERCYHFHFCRGHGQHLPFPLAAASKLDAALGAGEVAHQHSLLLSMHRPWSVGPDMVRRSRRAGICMRCCVHSCGYMW